MTKCGVVIIHGCGHKIFLEKKTLEDICSMVCGGCGGLIGLSLFGSSVKKQLLEHCEELTDEQIQKRLGKKQ